MHSVSDRGAIEDGYVRHVPLNVWPPTLGGVDPQQVQATAGVQASVYSFLQNPGDRAPLNGPFASRHDELAAFHPEG